MKYLYNWLKNLLGIESTQEKQSPQFAGVVIGKILEIAKHPNADRLQVTKTDVGGEVLQIVCGAPNITVGQMVPVAMVGTKLLNGMEIKEAEIRGVKSFGMLCAEDELGLGSNHGGIMILDEKAEIGMEFAKYIDLHK